MPRLTKIYTRTGDDGTTGLVDGSRIPKSDPLMTAIGEVDEANSVIGLAIPAVGEQGEDGIGAALVRIQNDLFDLGADLATPATDGPDPFAPSEMSLRIVGSQVARLEAEIDAANADLPALTNFILPGGGEAAARVQVARAVVRRAERAAIAAAAARPINPLALAYLNRLSDHLFVHARVLARGDRGEQLWVPGSAR